MRILSKLLVIILILIFNLSFAQFQDPLKPNFKTATIEGRFVLNYRTSHQYVLPLTRGANGTYLKSNGDGTLSWATGTSGQVADSAKVNTTNGDNMYGTYNLFGTLSATTSLFAKGSSATIGLQNTAGTSKFLLSLSGGHSAITTYTVPADYPSVNDQALVSTTAGSMSWKTFYPGDSVPWQRNNTRSATWTRYSDNVGIGTNAPSQKLHVDGSIKFTTNLFMESSTGAVGNIYKGGSLWMHNTEGGFYAGNYAGSTSVTGSHNLCTPNYAGYSLTSGTDNVLLGYYSGRSLTTENGNVFLGPYAGYSETESDRLVIDNRNRTGDVDTQYKYLVYGKFAELTSEQFFRINGILDWSVEPSSPKIFVQTEQPDIPYNTTAFWKDDAGYYWLILDISGTQKKVRLQ
ncbi:MAG: hypothetical protein ACOYMF_05345 [Bacteroidales bacterium]